MAPLLMAFAVVCVVLPTTINIGIRHILIIYPLLALAAGAGVVYLWRQDTKRHRWRLAAVLLISWHLWNSVSAHPDYLSNFNEIPGSRPERWVVGSGLDWGQDLVRLGQVLKEREVPLVHLAYFGTADPAWFGFPAVLPIGPGQRATGWVAASVTLLRHHQDVAEGYGWLGAFEPVERIGNSIYLFHIPD